MQQKRLFPLGSHSGLNCSLYSMASLFAPVIEVIYVKNYLLHLSQAFFWATRESVPHLTWVKIAARVQSIFVMANRYGTTIWNNHVWAIPWGHRVLWYSSVTWGFLKASVVYSKQLCSYKGWVCLFSWCSSIQAHRGTKKWSKLSVRVWYHSSPQNLILLKCKVTLHGMLAVKFCHYQQWLTSNSAKKPCITYYPVLQKWVSPISRRLCVFICGAQGLSAIVNTYKKGE